MSSLIVCVLICKQIITVLWWWLTGQEEPHNMLNDHEYIATLHNLLVVIRHIMALCDPWGNYKKWPLHFSNNNMRGVWLTKELSSPIIRAISMAQRKMIALMFGTISFTAADWEGQLLHGAERRTRAICHRLHLEICSSSTEKSSDFYTNF